MDQKQSTVVGLGIVAMLGLFVVVYAQFRAKDAADPTIAVPTGDQPWRSAKTDVVPVAEPETPEDIAAAIDAQLAEDAEALDEEVAAETADIEDELKSLDELNDAYDENAY